MALIKCHDCGSQVSKDAKKCQNCGAIPKTAANMISAIVGAAGVLFFLWFYFGGGLETQAKKEMAKITQQVANEQVEQYEITKKSGSEIEICVHAGMVSASYLQAKDEANYATWKGIERADCAAAGMPQP